MDLDGFGGGDGSHDFDFRFGTWRIRNERRRSWLTGSEEWERFAAVGTCRPILGGTGNVETFRPTWPGREGYEGVALRLFEPATERWSIYWAENESGQLGRPVVGRFVGGVGEFFGDDEHDGRPVRVRFRWTMSDAGVARWEQAFSADQGASWETNWVMVFDRIAEEEGPGER